VVDGGRDSRSISGSTPPLANQEACIHHGTVDLRWPAVPTSDDLFPRRFFCRDASSGPSKFRKAVCKMPCGYINRKKGTMLETRGRAGEKTSSSESPTGHAPGATEIRKPHDRVAFTDRPDQKRPIRGARNNCPASSERKNSFVNRAQSFFIHGDGGRFASHGTFRPDFAQPLNNSRAIFAVSERVEE